MAGRWRFGKSGAGVGGARAGAEIVIAANLSSDVFTHSTTIYSHGAPADAPEQVIEPVPPKRGFGKLFSAERTMKREFFGGGGRPGISSVMVDAFNIMQDRITRARLAGDPPDLADHASSWTDRLVRLPSRRRSDLVRCTRRRARHRIHSRGDPDTRAWSAQPKSDTREGALIAPGSDQAVLMYSRIASCSISYSRTRHLTMSPIEIRPTTVPSSTTGK